MTESVVVKPPAPVPAAVIRVAPVKQYDRMQLAFLFLLAAFALGQGVQVSNGNLHPESIRWLTIACVLTLIGVAAPAWRWIETSGEGLPVFAAGACVAYQLVQLFTTTPGIYIRNAGPQGLAPYATGLVLSAILIGAGLSKAPWLGKLHLPLLLCTFIGLGIWMVRVSPEPFIDVFFFQRDGVNALLAGNNPYALRYRDIYGNSPFYGEGLSVNGILQFGYPYPPLSLLLAIPGQVFGGDYRFSQVAAIALAALLMATARGGRIGFAAAALWIFTPREFFVIEQGWTEPFVVLGLAAVVFAACRTPRALPYLLGLFLAVKQYLVFAVPAAYLLFPKPLPPRKELLKFALKVFVTGCVVSLPLILWNPAEFWHDVVALQVYQPFRVEAMSFLAWAAQGGGERLPTALAFVAATLGVVIGLWRAPRTPAGFAATCSLAFIGFFAFNKQAFCNYYFFVIGALCVTAAAVQTEET